MNITVCITNSFNKDNVQAHQNFQASLTMPNLQLYIPSHFSYTIFLNNFCIKIRCAVTVEVCKYTHTYMLWVKKGAVILLGL